MNVEHPTASDSSHQTLQGRRDLSNSNVREDLARTGRCALVHLPTGRICLLPLRHYGPCEFHRPQDVEDVMSRGN